MADVPATITIPEGVDIDSLHITRDPLNGSIGFDWAPLETICAASGIDIDLLRNQHEDNVSDLIITWYAHSLAHGGKRNAILDQVIHEAMAEVAYGEGRVQRGSERPQ